jgi:hypothetical protein
MDFWASSKPDYTLAITGGFGPLAVMKTYSQTLQIIYSHRSINSINTYPQLNQQPSGKKP